MLFVRDSVPRLQRVAYQGSFQRVWKYSIRTGNSHLRCGELFIEGKREGRI